jgi:hypothetical protein
MAQRLVGKAEFGKLAGVSKPAISKALRGELRAALVGDRIDANHAAARAYLGKRGKSLPPAAAPTSPPKRRPRAAAAPTDPAESTESAQPEPTGRRRRRGLPAPRVERVEQLAEIEEYAELTIRELVERWGTVRTYVDLLGALKTIEDIRKTQLHNEETEGSLISRDLVRTHLFGLVDAVFKRLLSDVPRTIAGRVLALAKSSGTLEEAEKVVREQISSQLAPMKATALRVLREPPAPSVA